MQGDESSDAALPALKLRMVVSEGAEVGVPLIIDDEIPLAMLCFWLSATVMTGFVGEMREVPVRMTEGRRRSSIL